MVNKRAQVSPPGGEWRGGQEGSLSRQHHCRTTATTATTAPSPEQLRNKGNKEQHTVERIHIRDNRVCTSDITN